MSRPLTGRGPRLTPRPYSPPANFATLLQVVPAYAFTVDGPVGGCMFSRLGNLIKGFFSLFISGIEKRNPEALLELEQENLRKQIANFNQGLATHAGLCERIMGQVRKLEAEQKELRAKTRSEERRVGK